MPRRIVAKPFIRRIPKRVQDHVVYARQRTLPASALPPWLAARKSKSPLAEAGEVSFVSLQRFLRRPPAHARGPTDLAVRVRISRELFDEEVRPRSLYPLHVARRTPSNVYSCYHPSKVVHRALARYFELIRLALPAFAPAQEDAIVEALRPYCPGLEDQVLDQALAHLPVLLGIVKTLPLHARIALYDYVELLTMPSRPSEIEEILPKAVARSRGVKVPRSWRLKLARRARGA